MEVFSISDGRTSFWQWDVGQRLFVRDDACTEVHITNDTKENAKICKVYTENGKRFVDIPDVLLQADRTLKVYARVENESSEWTTHSETFVVLTRPKPDDYVYTEEEKRTWDDLNERMSDLEESKIEGVQKGRGKNAVELGEGNAGGDYSLAGGTTDGWMYEALSGLQKELSPAAADALFSIALGAAVQALSTGAIVHGVDCIAGCKGYYHNGDIFCSEADGAYHIGLYEDQDSKKPVTEIPWEIGDVISLNYGNAYPLIGEISFVHDNYICIYPDRAITILSDAELTEEKTGRKPDDLTVLVPAKPAVGAVEISYFAFANGFGCSSLGTLSTTFGQDNTALDKASFITGRSNIGSFAALVGGYKNTVLGSSAFAAGRNHIIYGMNGAATGELNNVPGWCANAKGYGNEASGGVSDAGGRDTKALADFSKTAGQGTIADAPHQFAHGKFNVRDTQKRYLEIVGNGTADNKRSNAYTLDKDGNAWFRGSIFVGGEGQDDGFELSIENIVTAVLDAMPPLSASLPRAEEVAL